MVRTSEAVDASVLTAAVRIDACVESDVGTLVVVNDRTSLVFQKQRVWLRIAGFVPIRSLVRRLFDRFAGLLAAPRPRISIGLFYNLPQMNFSTACEGLAELG